MQGEWSESIAGWKMALPNLARSPRSSLTYLFCQRCMAPDHLVPTPVSSLFSENDFPIFAAPLSKHRGRALVSSKPEALAKSVNLVSPPSPTPPEALIASPNKPPKPSRPSPPSPSTLASPLFPTFHSALVMSILAEGADAHFKSSSGSPLGDSACTGSGMGPARLISPPALEVHCSVMEEPRSDAADQNGALEKLAEEESELSVMALKCPKLDTQAIPECCGSVRANDIASLELSSSPDSLDSVAPIENPPCISWSKVVQQNIRGGQPLFLKIWKPGMALSKEEHKCFPIWITMTGVPVE